MERKGVGRGDLESATRTMSVGRLPSEHGTASRMSAADSDRHERRPAGVGVSIISSVELSPAAAAALTVLRLLAPRAHA